MQTILGANGVIGREVSRLLPEYTDRIRQVSRTPVAVNASDELFPADLLDPAATSRAVEGSEVAYLLVGLRYSAEVWEREWPRVMGNVIDACLRHGSRLVFFDNVYAYGRVKGVMTEETPFNPCSRKGEVRARIATTLLDAMGKGGLEAMIVRAADFYGPDAPLSLTQATVFSRLAAGKKPQWVGDPRAVHSFTYTPDAGRTVALLANTPGTWGQTWHALTSRETMTGEAFIRTACDEAGHPFGMQVAPRWMLRVMGLFHPVLRENDEMMYQFEEDYRFDSRKVENALSLQATPYPQGISAALRAARAAATP
jgi:nucleoside-diphosphate-sugar epimerase